MKTKSNILVHTDAIEIEMREVRKVMASINPRLGLYKECELRLVKLEKEYDSYRKQL
jgi:hypothetical protein